MREFGLIAAAASALFAIPAAAMTPGQANCPAQLAPKDLGPRLVQAMMTYKEGQDSDPGLTDAIKKVNDACVTREKVPEARRDAYLRYVMARLSHDELARQLGAMKVSTAVIDSVFEIGPGKRNPTPDSITDAQFEQLVAALDKAGMPIDKLPEAALGMMGAYVTVTGEMYRDQAAID